PAAPRSKTVTNSPMAVTQANAGTVTVLLVCCVVMIACASLGNNRSRMEPQENARTRPSLKPDARRVVNRGRSQRALYRSRQRRARESGGYNQHTRDGAPAVDRRGRV